VAAPDDIIARRSPDTLALLHAASFEGAQRLANLKKLVARAARHARDWTVARKTLAPSKGVCGGTDRGREPAADETIDAVRILSVHKPRARVPGGVVPDLGPRSQPSALPERERPGGARGKDIWPSPRRRTCNLAGLWRSRRDGNEAPRKAHLLLACTRAKERLILVNANGNPVARRPGGTPSRARLQDRGGLPRPAPLAESDTSSSNPIPPPSAAPLREHAFWARPRPVRGARRRRHSPPPLRPSAGLRCRRRPDRRPEDPQDAGRGVRGRGDRAA